MASTIAHALLGPRYENVGDLPTTQFQQAILGVIYLVGGVAILTYCLRMYTKFYKQQVGLEDWLMTAAMSISIALMPVYYFYIRYSFVGFSEKDVPASYNPEASLLWTWIAGLLYNPILALVKSSALVFMLRIAGHRTDIKWAVYIINSINICLMIAVFFVVIFQQWPIASYWDKSLRVDRSIDTASFAISTPILTIVTDILVLAIPFRVFTGLKVNLGTRVGVIIIFTLSGVVTVVGILRLRAFVHLFYDPGYDYSNTWGPSYSFIEPNLAIIAANIPSLRPLLRKWIPRLFSSNGSKQPPAGPYQQHRDYPDERSGRLNRGIQLQHMSHSSAQCGSSGDSPYNSRDGIVKTTAASQTLVP